MRIHIPVLRLSLLACLLLAADAGAQPPPATGYREVAAILGSRCVVCHSGPSAPLGLRLDSLANLLAGSQRGPVVVKGEPAKSELVRRIRGESLPRMPLTGPPFLSDQEIALVERWVAEGLPQGEPAAAPASAPRPPPRKAPGERLSYADVAPILLPRCAKCHTQNGLRGPAPEGLLLNNYENMLASAERARVVPGHPRASELWRRIMGIAQPRMPFDGPPYLNQEEIALIEAWIAQGARDAQGRPAPVPVGARVRLHGRLSALWVLDGLDLRVDGGTRLDKGPSVGDYVEVRGIIEADGRIRATRIRPR